MEIILDTNAFQKYYGYSKNKNNNDEMVDLIKLNQLLNDSNNELILPVYCLYEILTKPNLLKSNYVKSLNNTLMFIMHKNIKIASIDMGKLIYQQINIFDFWRLNIKETISNAYKSKIEVEQKEIYEYISYTLFISKYLIADILNLKLYENNMVSKKLTDKLLSFLEENEQHYKNLIKQFCYQKVVDSYTEADAKQAVKTSIMQIYQQFFHEIYEIISNNGGEWIKLCQEEIALLNKFANKYEYIKNRISYIEKNTKSTNYLENINNLYYKEIKNLGYNKYFCDYLMSILKKNIRQANFDKNDAIDNSLFLFKNKNNFILSFENNFKNFLKISDSKNFDFIQNLIKKI